MVKTERREGFEIQHGTPMRFENGVTIFPNGVEHTPEFYEANKLEIGKLISQGDFIVSEYDPLTVGQLVNQSISTDNRQTVNTSPEFYNRLLTESWIQSKLLLYVDPLSPNLTSISFADILIGCGIGGSAMIETLHRRKITRRDFLIALTVSVLGLGIANASLFMERITHISVKPFSQITFRNSGAVAGLSDGAENKIVSGNGVLFVGAEHIEPYTVYAADIPSARADYHMNISTIFSENSALGPSPVRLWEPDKSSPDTFVLTKVINRK